MTACMLSDVMNDRMTSLWSRTSSHVCTNQNSWYVPTLTCGRAVIPPARRNRNVNHDVNDDLSLY